MEEIKFFLNKKQRILIAFLFIGVVMSSILEMVGVGSIPIFINLLLNPDKLTLYLPQSNFTTFFLNQTYLSQVVAGAVLLSIIFLIKNIFLLFIIYFQTHIFRNLRITKTKELFESYIYSPYYLNLSRNPASLSRNVTTEVHTAVGHIESYVFIAREILLMVAIFILLLLVDTVTVLIVFLTISTFSAIYYFTVKNKIKILSKIAQFDRARQVQLVNQVFGSIKDTIMLDRQSYFVNQFKNTTKKIERFIFVHSIVQKLPRLFLEILGVIVILLITVLFVMSDRSTDSIITTLTLLGVASIKLLPSFNTTSVCLTNLKASQVSFDLVVRDMMYLEKYRYKKNNLMISNKADKENFSKSIEVKNIIYRYPETNKDVLKNLSFEIKSGSSVGVIGETGSGKSTLVDIIIGLLEPTNGQILVDGKNIHSNNNCLIWQKQIGYIPQDIYLIDDTIKRNIAFGVADEDIDEKKVWRSIKLAELSNFVSNLPLKIDAIVGNRGIKLSGGQIQRIGIARALYRKSKVLVLDEATSSLDIETEKAIVKSLESIGDKITLIVITHRLETLKNFKKIYIIKEGSITNCGSYQEITEKKNIYNN